jgi:hypothetical protein
VKPESLRVPGPWRPPVTPENNQLVVAQQLSNPPVPENQQDYSYYDDYGDDDYTTTSGRGEAGRSEDATPRAMPHIDQTFGNITSSGSDSVNRVGNHGGGFHASLKTRTGDIVVTDGAKQSVGNTGGVDDGK